MKTIRIHTALELDPKWDQLSNILYQKRNFLRHLEKTNPLQQRYYLLYDKQHLVAGAIVYSLRVNFFTFSKKKLKLPMQIIGLPVSCDAGGLLGDKNHAKVLIKNILKQENGIVLCLNHEQEMDDDSIIKMQNLPGMILKIKDSNWEDYVHSMRHPYRRRIKMAIARSREVRKYSGSCSDFSVNHYNQYLDVLSRSRTKLEILPMAFLKELPNPFRLNSYYFKDTLLYWHISFTDRNIYHFLFGGMDYSKRDTYDSYTNNLIEIIKDGMAFKCHMINLGQTAEIAKARFGAVPSPRAMFLYHKNSGLRWIFRALKNQLTYSAAELNHSVFKENHESIEITKKHFQYA